MKIYVILIKLCAFSIRILIDPISNNQIDCYVRVHCNQYSLKRFSKKSDRSICQPGYQIFYIKEKRTYSLKNGINKIIV